MTIPGYIPPIGERDLDKIVRAVRNLYEGGAAAADAVDLTAALSRKSNVLTPHEGLIIKWVTAATVDIDADAVVLFDTDGNPKRFTSLNETLNIANSGANGLDTGSEANSTWYYIHAIGKTDDTLDGLFSTSATAPTLPSGYTYSGLLGAIYNNSSGDLIRVLQRGRVATRETTNVLLGGTQTNYTAVSLTAAIPLIATAVVVTITAVSTSGTNIVSMLVAPDGSTTTSTYGGDASVSANIDANGLQSWGRVVHLGGHQVMYRVAGTNASGNLAVRGWEF